MKLPHLCMLLAVLGTAGAGLAQTIEQMPGWPIALPGYHGAFRGVAFADLDSDGDLEVIVSNTVDWQVHAWDFEGNRMPGFPVDVGTCAPKWAPSIGDLDGDGDPELVVLAHDPYGNIGELHAFDHLGNLLPGFPIELSESQWFNAPTLIDLDGDGQLEILASEHAYPSGYLHVIRNDGSEWGGNWPLQLDAVPGATPAVGDINGDGDLEICMLSAYSIYVLKTDGSLLPGWPLTLSSGNSMSYGSPVLADLDADGHREIVLSVCTTEGSFPAGACHIYRDDGTAFPGWPQSMGMGWTYSPPHRHGSGRRRPTGGPLRQPGRVRRRQQLLLDLGQQWKCPARLSVYELR